jgi:hypothetical protein
VTNGTVVLKTVRLRTTGLLGVPVPDVTLVATHAPDHVCAAGETYTVGVTDLNGELLVALPYGTWEISAVGFTPATGSWPSAVLDPNDPSTPDVEVQTL